MARCPFCGVELEYLDYHSHEVVSYTLTKEGELKERYIEDVYDQSIRCPECGEEITRDYDSAVLFLEGEVVLVKGDNYDTVGARPLRDGKYILCGGRIYELVDEDNFITRSYEVDKVYMRVEDEVIESIIAAAES